MGRPGGRTGRAALAAALLALIALPAAAQAQVTVSGRIKMGTAGVPLPAGLTVVGSEIDEGGKAGELKRQVSNDGTFRIEGFAGSRLFVGVEHQGVTYAKEVRSKDAEITIDLEIFETTADPSVVSVASNTITVLQGKGDTMEVLEVLRVANSSDRTFTGMGDGQPRPIVLLALPEGAFDLSPAEKANPRGLAPTAMGPAATSPLYPGQTQISYLYKVRVPRTGFQFRRESVYSTGKVDLLVGPGLKLQAGPGLKFQETKKLGNTTYRRYRSGELAAGALLGADIVYEGETGGGLWIGLGAALATLAVATVGSAVLSRKRHRKETQPEAGREEIIEQIARLDAEFEKGAMDQGTYRRDRERMKRRLARLS
ncbi:MAG: hypothetical protein ACRDIU_06145 [Actinomycetota bacterium]